ncbi:hypothetical protein Poli38472_005839 [Pythium oligandrum]|uniref:tRNA:m(4)X modification enzyme TRM13 n=1 Tax=Pythium oligandrum TaxID=41045 RepID=A0A8K1FML3_PYTOL|nr:hypothetical protein Poli38472_005839 [Pythium oligandrum]|eukprot:TMW68371.1 hypothetical protein Poli38472_005839 [Pythium oligandrum]
MTTSKKREMESSATEERKKRKQEKLAAMKSGEWDRCMFRIVRKNRFCNMERINGALFCGNHLPADAQVSSKSSQQFKAELRSRVPCPIDGSHTVYQYDLEKHLKVCNKTRDAEAAKALPYYSENINSGTHAVTTREELKAAEVSIEASDDTEKEHDGPTAQQEQSLIDKLAALDFADLVKRVNSAYDTCVGSIPTEKLRHSCCDALLTEKTAAGASRAALRHIEQQASIIGHMERAKLLDSKAAFLELGAGRGMLSLALAQTFPDSLYVLIDRAGSRGKADHFIRDNMSDTSAHKVMRAKIDIRHLNLAGMKELVDMPIVGMSKHLCGVATDLSLRAIANTVPVPESHPAGVISPAFKGIAVALCCHHACQWEDYSNPEFFLAQGFSAQEFPLLKGMTSWATCAMQATGDTVEQVLGITKSDRAILGRKIKRILDAGRIDYLKRLGLQTQLVHYCEVDDSVENCLLLAWRA